MIAYYRILELLKDHLQADSNVNTVTVGDFDGVDVDKHSIYPIALINIGDSTPANGLVKFDVTVAVMDLVDERKTNRDELPAAERWKGQDNKQDVLNTTLYVLENLEASINKGTLQEFGLELDGAMTKNPFEDRFDNLLTGWAASFNVAIPNERQACGNSYALKEITFSNDLITFSNDNNK